MFVAEQGQTEIMERPKLIDNSLSDGHGRQVFFRIALEWKQTLPRSEGENGFLILEGFLSISEERDDSLVNLVLSGGPLNLKSKTTC